MAQYRYSEVSISRGKGRSAVKYAAYCHATKMNSEVEGPSGNHIEKTGQLMHSEIVLPEHVPRWAAESFGEPAFLTALESAREHHDGDAAAKAAWATCSERLWNSVELAERKLHPRFSVARYAFSAIISNPVELPLDHQVDLVRGFVESAYVQHGMCVDWVIHDTNEGHPHVHIIFTTRCLEVGGWGRKMHPWADWNVILERRGLWAQHANVSLGALRVQDWIDHRNYSARGLKLIPDTASPHLGVDDEGEGPGAQGQERATRAKKRNQAYLKRNPEHFVDIVQASKHSFTEIDLRAQVKKRMEVSVTTSGLEEICVTADELRALGDQAMKSTDLVRVEPDTPEGAHRLMTRTRLTANNGLKELARRLAERSLTADHPALSKDAVSTNGLSPSQRAATEAMVASERITLVQSRPGPVLDTVLERAANIWRSRGFDVCATTFPSDSRMALENLNGIRFRPLSRWDFLWSRGKDTLTEQTIFILTDAGMVDIPYWSRILDQVSKTGGKVIAARDPNRPLPGVGSSGWSSVEAGVGYSIGIGKVVWQRHVGDRMATAALERGGSGAKGAIEHYMRNGAIRLCGQSEDPFATLAKAYFETGSRGESRIGLGYSPRDVRALNQAIREEALQSGVVERAATQFYGVANYMDRSGWAPQIGEVPLEFGPGDRIRLTQRHPELGPTRFALGLVTAAREDAVDVRMDGSSGILTLDVSMLRHIDYGYAVALADAEPVNADHAFVLPNGSMHRHAVHVALTRHRETVTVFGRPGHVESVADLIHLAQTPGHARISHRDVPDSPREAPLRTLARVSGTKQPPVGRTAHDIGPLIDHFAREGFGTGISALSDEALIDVAGRFAERLASSRSAGDPVISDRLSGYARDPTVAIKDLLQDQAIVRADEIAERIAREVAEPETFLRRFMSAMAHPDLVRIPELRQQTGKANVFSTRSALGLRAKAVRETLHLAELTLSETALEPTGVNEDLFDQAMATGFPEADESRNTGENPLSVRYGLSAKRLNLIRCSGSCDKAGVLLEIVRECVRLGWTTIGVAPSIKGLSVLGYEGVHNLTSVRAFLDGKQRNRIEHGETSLVILNDASVIGSDDVHALLQLVLTGGGRFVALLDDSPSATVEENAVFRALELRCGARRTLPEATRNSDRSNVLDLLSCSGERHDRALAALNEDDALRHGGSLRGAIERIARDFVADAHPDRIAVTSSQVEADAVNEAVRTHLDAVDPRRRGNAGEFEGRLAGLKCGDRIRLLEGWPRAIAQSQEETCIATPEETDNPLVHAGEIAEVISRSEKGDLKLRLENHEGSRDITIPSDTGLPGWRFAFAGTVESELPQSRDSVHVLVSRRMTGQALLSIMKVHRRNLNLVVPVAESVKLGHLRETLRRRDSKRVWLDCGYRSSLSFGSGAEDSPEHPNRDSDECKEAMMRVTEYVRLGECVLPDAFPSGVAGSVLVDMFGASVLTYGRAPSDIDRLYLESLVSTFDDSDNWRKILGQMPKSLPDQADAVARTALGAEATERTPTQASKMAAWMLTAQMLGENVIADRLEAGLALFGTRFRLARLYAKTNDWAHSGAEGREPAAKGGFREFDVGSILAEVPQAEERAAYETVALFGVNGSDRIGRVRKFEDERQGGWNKWEGRERTLGIEREERWCRNDAALVMACTVAARTEARDLVHRLHLCPALRPLLTAANEALDRVRENAEPIARKTARSRAMSDLRVRMVKEVDGDNRFAAEQAQIYPEPYFVDQGKMDSWRTGYRHAVKALSGHDLDPTRLEWLAAAAPFVAETELQKHLAEAMTQALALGSPIWDADGFRRERTSLMSELEQRYRPDDPADLDRTSKLVARLYMSFTEPEIRGLADSGSGLVEELAPGSDGDRIAGNVRSLHGSRHSSLAPWFDRYQEKERSLQTGRGRERGIAIDPF